MSDTFDVVWSPGPRPLYQQAGNRNFYVVDLESGQERLLIRDSSVGWVGSPIYSPDGRRIVLFWSRRAGSGLWTVDAASERATQLYTTSDPSNVVPTPIAWSNDGAIVFAVEGKRAAYRGLATPLRETLTQVRIVGVPSGGGRPSLLVRLPFEEVGGVAISADGRWLVCSVYSSRSDIWIVRNFDAAQAAFSTARALR
jgi:Tol biopolymer transport system component